MKTINQKINRSALAVQFFANCPSAEQACPEMTGALRIAYGSRCAMVNDIDS